MYKRLKNAAEAAKENTPKASMSSADSEEYVTKDKCKGLLSKMATVIDEELSVRDKRLDRLDGDVLNHEERIQRLENKYNGNSQPEPAPAPKKPVNPQSLEQSEPQKIADEYIRKITEDCPYDAVSIKIKGCVGRHINVSIS